MEGAYIHTTTATAATARATGFHYPGFLARYGALAEAAATLEDNVGGVPSPGRDVEKLTYLRRLIVAIREGRRITEWYNVVLLTLLLCFSAWHWLEKTRRRKRRDAACLNDVEEGGQEDAADSDDIASSSSSTLQGGALTPPNVRGLKYSDVDVERTPLLLDQKAKNGRQVSSSSSSSSSSGSSSRTNKSILTKLSHRLRGWLTHQPPPLPVINRSLPSNGTTLFILAFLGLNTFFHLHHVPLEPKFFFAFADRAACVFITNLPLLYLLAAKNQPIKHLTGRSYESLNLFHRRVGELLCFEAAVHFLGMLSFHAFLGPRWLFENETTWQFFHHRLVLLGLGAFVSYQLLFLTALGSFRQRWYELFLASHVTLQMAGMSFLWLHFNTSRPYVSAALAIFVLDRVIWRLLVKSTVLTADITVLPDGDTLLLSANWSLPLPSEKKANSWLRPFSSWTWRRRNIRQGWKPADHVFLTVPTLGTVHALQAHPFTIASAAPPPYCSSSQDGTSRHAWFTLLIRSHDGFTTKLLNHAHLHRSVQVRLDGPYGSSRSMDMLGSVDDVVLVAGGSGIAVVFPLAWALVMGKKHENPAHDEPSSLENTNRTSTATCCASSKNGRRVIAPRKGQRVRLLWVMHFDEHRLWIPSTLMDDMVAAGLEVVMPSPTAVAGRPDVDGYLGDWISAAEESGGRRRRRRRRKVGVLVSGPDGLNRATRNCCARAVGGGADVEVMVEKFGW